MPTCRCKMCGGQIHYGENDSVAKCEFCGTEQTVVRTDDAKQLNLFNRANSLRLQNEFDKAQTTYENILIDDPNNAEAHWGICLCRYGIEYVDDKKTNKKVPTCHRTVFNFIFDDIDYQEATKNADVVAKKMYQNEAKVIDKIQKNILAISQKEDPYDIFICYKETDENGKRTKDSVVAQEIYDELINRGYKVFFSRISLESKIGSDYEPIIFAALMSSKVMLAIGSKVEFFNSPWVKNEWGRFLSFMKDQHGKYLIPCYFDMEAYDMPEEFLMLQAQDIGKVGYLQDLSRGIDKIFDRTRKVVTEVKIENSENSSSPKIDNMLKRVKLSLEDQEWVKANGIIEDILNIDVECAEAYLYKILVEYRAKNVDELINKNEPLDNDKNYNRALRFASDEYREYLVEINKTIKERIENLKKETIYRDVIQFMGNGNYIVAMNSLKNLHDYKDSEKLREECYKKCYEIALDYKSAKNYDEAINVFNSIRTYKDSIKQIDECKELKLFENEKNTCLKICKALDDIIAKIEKTHEITDQNRNSYNTGLKTLSSIKLYADAEDKCRYYFSRLNELENEIKEYKIQQEEERKRRAEKRKKLIIFWSKLGSVIAVCLVAIILLTTLLFVPMGKYNKAQSYINKGEYKKASEVLSSISYKDSKKQVQLLDARNYLEKGDYESAINIVYNMGGTTNVSYDSNGGNSNSDSEVIKKAKYITNEGDKIGSDFKGWIISNYSINYKKHSLDLTLKASYEPIVYSISYSNVDENEWTIIPPKEYIYDNGEISIQNPKRTGYTFVGWTSNYYEGTIKDLVISNTQYGNISLTAVWKLNDYTIEIDTAGGLLNVSNIVEVPYNNEYTLPVPTREGYTFTGYLYDGDYITDENGNPFEKYTYLNGITVVADWSINTYRITFTAQTGGKVSMDYCYSEYNAPISVYAYTAVSYNHTFVGWYLDDVLVSDLSTLTINTPAKDTNYVAKFVEYTLTTSTNLSEAGTVDIYDGKGIVAGREFTINATVNDGYTFLGWYNGTTRLTTNTSYTFYMPKQSVTYTAKYSTNAYSVVLSKNNENGGTISGDGVYDYNSTVTINASPNDGYLFYGWFINGNCISNDNNYSFILESTVTVEIMARFDRRIYNFNVELNISGSGTLSGTNNGSYEYEYAFEINVASHIGYNFIGWFINNVKVGNNMSYSGNIPSNNLNIIAKFEVVDEMSNFVFTSTTNTCIINSIIDKTVTSIFVPKYVTEIDEGAFKGCSILEAIKLPFIGDKIHLISDENQYPFGYIFGKDYYSGSTITYQEYRNGNVEDYNVAYYLPSSLKDIEIYGGKYIQNGSFEGCTNVKTIIISSEITSIEKRAFYSCSNLECLLIPGSITYVGVECFKLDSNLNKLYFKGTINNWCTIDFEEDKSNPMLYGNANFYLLDDYGNVSYLGNNYSLLTELIIPNSITQIKYHFYGFACLRSVVIPDSVTIISDSAFAFCTNIKNIIVPNSVTTIGEGAFKGCTKLEKIEVPFVGSHSLYSSSDKPQYPFGYIFGYDEIEGTTQATQKYYYSDSLITSYFYIPNSLKEVVISGSSYIAYGAFHNCSLVEKIVISSSVNMIVGGSFKGCSSLKSIEIPFVGQQRYTQRGANQFPFGYIFGSENFSNSTITRQNYCYSVSAYGDTYTFTSADYYIPDSLEEVVISSTSYIQCCSFYNCTNIKNIKFDCIVSYIDNGAFYGCGSIEEFVIPSTIEKIEASVFALCHSLENIEIPVSINEIFESAFYDCPSLTNVYYDGTLEDWCNIAITGNKYSNPMYYASNFYILDNNGTIAYNEKKYSLVTRIEIPESITMIGSYKFFGFNNVTEIIVPNSVLVIADSAFGGCSSLVSITIPFIGDAEHTPNSSNQFPFGYIFGEESYEGCVARYQTFKGENSNTITKKYYIPSSIREVKITNSANLQYGAFHNCDFLTDIILSNQTVHIGSYAFRECNNLVSLVIPNYVTSIDQYAFYEASFEIVWGDNPSLETIECFAEYKGTNITIPCSARTISSNAFLNCKNITSITIPDNVISIGLGAFVGCSSLKSITIPFVGDSAHNSSDTTQYPFGYIFGSTDYTGGTGTTQTYYDSTSGVNTRSATYYIPSSLTEVTLTSCSYIQYGAFYNCSALEIINISDEVIEIGQCAFLNCSNLTSIILPSNLICIRSSAFSHCSQLETLVIPNTVINIYSSAFYNCTNLVSIYYDGSIEDWCNIIFATDSSNPIGANDDVLFYIYNSNGDITFNNKKYSLLEYLSIPNSINEVGDYQFFNFRQLKYISLSNDITRIGEYSFVNCRYVDSLIIPYGVISIGNGAFELMKGLNELTIPNSVESIGKDILWACSSLEKISIPFVGDKAHLTSDTDQYVFGYIFGTSSFTSSIAVDQYYYQNYIYGTKKETYYFPANLHEVEVTNSNYIQRLAFNNCSFLTNISLANTITLIGNGAFDGCAGLTEFVIPNSVTEIGITSFRNCTGLTRMVIPYEITTLSNSLFQGCTGLQEIIIPTSIISIGEQALSGCSNLSNVYYEGTKNDWDSNVSIGINNESLNDVIVYYYSVDEPDESGNYWHYVNEKPTIW